MNILNILEKVHVRHALSAAGQLYAAYRIDAADEVLRVARNACPDNRELLYHALTTRAHRGRFQEAAGLMAEWNAAGELSHPVADAVADAMRRGLQDASDIVQSAWAFLHDREFSHPELQINGCLPQAPLGYRFILPIDAPTAHQLESVLNVHLAPDAARYDGRLAFGCLSAQALADGDPDIAGVARPDAPAWPDLIDYTSHISLLG